MLLKDTGDFKHSSVFMSINYFKYIKGSNTSGNKLHVRGMMLIRIIFIR